jgi:anaerobic selenocysteine-containing dehydrogenase
VHTQGRTASQKYLSEIVHHNPLWINTATAQRHNVRTGDLVEITTYRPGGHALEGAGEKVGSATVPVYVTEGIHPRVIAMSNSLGNVFHGRAGTATRGRRQNLPAWNDEVIAEDQDVRDDIWWDRRNGGTGAGYNINAILPIQPSPLVGMQGWYDTVCTIRKA